MEHNPAIIPYLTFGTHADEAIEFYKSALEAEVLSLMRFNENPDPMPPGMLPDGFEDKVMHATLRIGQAVIMLSDGMSAEMKFSGFGLMLPASSKEQADKYFAGLSEGGSVDMPLGETFWSPYFGMVTDKFGVGWMISLPSPMS